MNKLTAYLHIQILKRARTRQPQNLRQAAGHIGWGLAVLFCLACAFGFAGLWGFYFQLSSSLPSVDSLPALLDPVSGSLLVPTRFYDRTGQLVLGEISLPGIQRHFLHLESAYGESFSPDLINATVAVVDPSFWSNPGYTLTELDHPDEHPTLTQQLVYSLFFSQTPPSLDRALKERLFAAQITSRFGKKQILEWYLNSVYYGHRAYGADAAARLYFAKPASQINLAESTLLAAVSTAPALNPLDAPAAAKTLQVETLRRMSASGMIAEKDVLNALQTQLSFSTLHSQTQPNQALVDLAASQTEDLIGTQQLERGGYKVITTADADLQAQTDCTIKTQINRLSSRTTEGDNSIACSASRSLPAVPADIQYPSGSLSASAIITDPSTGQVLAYSATDPNSPTNHPPGTIITPFIYLAGYSTGITPGILYWDIPARMPAVVADLPSPDRKFHGPQRQRVALVNDYLGHTAQIENQVGMDRLQQIYHQFGIDPGAEDTSAAFRLPWLGGGVSLLEISTAYDILANQGTDAGQISSLAQTSTTAPTASVILKVQDISGKTVLDRSTPVTLKVVNPQLAFLLTDMLADATTRQPVETLAGSLDTGRNAAVKIGQTAYGKDSWVVGYTPQRLTAVWVGLSAQMAPASVLSPRAPSGIWSALFNYSGQEISGAGWEMPDGIRSVVVCDPSGDLPSRDCPTTVHENFIAGTEPTTQDHLYQVFQVNQETGRLATVFTQPEAIENRTYLAVPADAMEWARQAGINVPPVAYDVIQKPPIYPDVHFSTPAMFASIHGVVPIIGTADGTNFSYYRLQVGQGINPSAWTQIGETGTARINDGTLTSWDTTGLTGLYALQLQVVNSDQQVTTATIQVTVDNTPPSVEIIYPAALEQIQGDQPITLMASVKDDFGIAKVEYYLDGKLFAAVETSPYIAVWTPTSGQHDLQVWAYDSSGNITRSKAITFSAP